MIFQILFFLLLISVFVGYIFLSGRKDREFMRAQKKKNAKILKELKDLTDNQLDDN
jgi:hypothetical protein